MSDGVEKNHGNPWTKQDRSLADDSRSDRPNGWQPVLSKGLGHHSPGSSVCYFQIRNIVLGLMVNNFVNRFTLSVLDFGRLLPLFGEVL